MNKFLLILFVLMNVFCFWRVSADKRIAESKTKYKSKEDSANRIAEVSIVAYSAFGGALGTLLGFEVFKHKVSKRKKYLRENLYIMLIENFILYISLFFNFRKKRE